MPRISWVYQGLAPLTCGSTRWHVDKISALGRVRAAEMELNEAVYKALENNYTMARLCLEQAKKDIDLAIESLSVATIRP